MPYNDRGHGRRSDYLRSVLVSMEERRKLTTYLENGLLTQSRLILLDSPLIVFTAFTALAWTCFTNQHEQGPAKAFSPSWWFWLVASGFGLGATVSVKWVGLFTIAWVGSLTILQLWVLLGDSRTVTPVGSSPSLVWSTRYRLTKTP